jgi:hypothetical protein
MKLEMYYHLVSQTTNDQNNMSALQNAASPKIDTSKPWMGQDGKSYRSFQIWQNEGWSQSFLQVMTERGWVTLY